MRKKTDGHPGQVLDEKFLTPMGVNSRTLADAIRVPVSRIDEVVKGKAAITADLALRLGKYFANGPEFWLKLQMDYDLRTAGEEIRAELEAIPQHDAETQKASPAGDSGRAAERKKIRDAWLEKNKDSDYIRGALDLLASADLDHPDDDIARAAIAIGDMEVIRKIEKAGFDRWAVPEVGYFAFLTPCLDVIEFLIGHGHNVNTVYGGYKFYTVKSQYSGIRDLGTHRPSESDYEWITTPLCQAVEHGFAEVVEYLISVGADVNFRDYYGLTPLHFAADSYSLDTVKALVAGGADVNARSRPDHWGSNDDSVLYYMVLRGFFEGLRYLVEHGALLHAPDKEDFLLHIICRETKCEGKIRETTEFLLDHGFDPFQIQTCKTVTGPAPVYLAVSCCNIAALRALVSHGVRFDGRYVPDENDGMKKHGQLLYAEIAALSRWESDESMIEALELIADHGVPLLQTHALNCAAGITALPGVCRWLLEKGCRVNDTWIPPEGAIKIDRYIGGAGTYFSPLHAVTSKSEPNAELVALLLEAGAEVDQRTPGGYTPLAWAVCSPKAHDAAEVITLLHQAGADFNAKTDDYRDQDTHRLIRGRTILQIAKRNKAPAEIMELLQKFGAQ